VQASAWSTRTGATASGPLYRRHRAPGHRRLLGLVDVRWVSLSARPLAVAGHIHGHVAGIACRAAGMVAGVASGREKACTHSALYGDRAPKSYGRRAEVSLAARSVRFIPAFLSPLRGYLFDIRSTYSRTPRPRPVEARAMMSQV
jgi:hypothetical protein